MNIFRKKQPLETRRQERDSLAAAEAALEAARADAMQCAIEAADDATLAAAEA